MKDNYEIIDSKVKERFENYNPKPKDHIWEGIEKNIPAQRTLYSKIVNLRNFTIFITSAIIISSIIYFVNKVDDKSSDSSQTAEIIVDNNPPPINSEISKEDGNAQLLTEKPINKNNTLPEVPRSASLNKIEKQYKTNIEDTETPESIKVQSDIITSTQSISLEDDSIKLTNINERDYQINLPPDIDRNLNIKSTPIYVQPNLNNELKDIKEPLTSDDKSENSENVGYNKVVSNLPNSNGFTFCDSLQNIMTPNGDGRNDIWMVHNYLEHRPIEISIYNKGNRLVYSSIDYTNNWRGTYKGSPLPEGTYFYLLKTYKAQCRGAINILK